MEASVLEGPARRTGSRRRGVVRAAVLLLAAAVALAGCATGVSESEEQRVRDAIVDDAPGVDDAVVDFHVDVFTSEVDIALTMPTASGDDPAAIVAAVDVALEKGWMLPKFQPKWVSVAITTEPFAEDDTPGRVDGMRLDDLDLDKALDLEQRGQRGRLVVGSADLEVRYGQRGDS